LRLKSKTISDSCRFNSLPPTLGLMPKKEEEEEKGETEEEKEKENRRRKKKEKKRRKRRRENRYPRIKGCLDRKM
jgi:hypothetical protein